MPELRDTMELPARIGVNESTSHISELQAHTCGKSLLSDTATGKPDYCAYICAHADMFPFVIHATGTKRLRFSYRATCETLYLRFDLVQKIWEFFFLFFLIFQLRFIGIRAIVVLLKFFPTFLIFCLIFCVIILISFGEYCNIEKWIKNFDEL